MAKQVVTSRPLSFEDTPETWEAVLGVTPDDAVNVRLALHRLVKSTDPHEQGAMFVRLIKDLRGAARNTNAFVVCLGEAEFCGLFFESINEAIRVFRWIDAQYAAAAQARPKKEDRRRGRRAGRVQKDLKYWETFILVTSHLFAHFRGHWTCGIPDSSTPSSEVLITSFELAHAINGIIPPCHLVQVVHIASKVGISPDLIKTLVLAHHPSRINDFTALMRMGLLTSETCWELASRPELVAALSYEGLRHLLTAWRERPQTELLAFARGLVSELYPQGVPTGENPVWPATPVSLVSFLAGLTIRLNEKNKTAFRYIDHDEVHGRYVPQDARILLSPETVTAPPAVDPLEEDEDIVLEMPEGNPDDDFVGLTIDLITLSEDDNPPGEPDEPAVIDSGLDEEVFSIWMEAFEARAQVEHDRLALLDGLPEESPTVEVASTPWTDVHELIAMDAREGREGIEDPNLQALLADLEEVERLLDLATRGDTDGVLALWSVWMDPVRDRIRALDARLKELASRPTTVTEVVLVQAPAPPTLWSGQAVVESPPVVESAPESEPTPKPAPTVPPPAPQPAPTAASGAPDLPPLPDGELGEIFREVYASLARLPPGTMNRQIAGQLEDLRAEAIADGNPRSIRPRTEALRGEIHEFLDIINDNSDAQPS